jgi:hypothetical protein
VSLAPDILIGAVVAYSTSTGFLGVVGTVIGLQVFYLAAWMKNRAWNWLVFRLSGDRENLSLAMLDYLRKNQFPEPDRFFCNVSTYFESMANNSDLACELRIKAAAELTACQSMPKFGGQLRLLTAWNDAIEKYRLTFHAADRLSSSESIGTEFAST